MATQYGAFLAGLNLVLRALSGGRIIVENAFSQILLQTHNSSAASQVIKKSLEPITTADATATVITSVPVALGSAVGGKVTIIGKKTGAADSYVGTYQFAGVNNGGTTAEIAAESAMGTVQENSAGTPAVTVVANDTTDTLEIKVAGIAAESWKWTGVIEYQTITYA